MVVTVAELSSPSNAQYVRFVAGMAMKKRLVQWDAARNCFHRCGDRNKGFRLDRDSVTNLEVMDPIQHTRRRWQRQTSMGRWRKTRRKPAGLQRWMHVVET